MAIAKKVWISGIDSLPDILHPNDELVITLSDVLEHQEKITVDIEEDMRAAQYTIFSDYDDNEEEALHARARMTGWRVCYPAQEKGFLVCFK